MAVDQALLCSIYAWSFFVSGWEIAALHWGLPFLFTRTHQRVTKRLRVAKSICCVIKKPIFHHQSEKKTRQMTESRSESCDLKEKDRSKTTGNATVISCQNDRFIEIAI